MKKEVPMGQPIISDAKKKSFNKKKQTIFFLKTHLFLFFLYFFTI